jgi:poly(A) polymerase
MARLSPQAWMTGPAAKRVMDALDAVRPGCARFVGGCVRDALLGVVPADIDIASQLTPDAVAAAMKRAGVAVHETGVEHGTLTVVADHQPFEITTLRRDVETDGRRATVAFTEDWAEDAGRRDFRINALYAAPDGEVFDPTGGGLDDLAAGRVVFVGDPETRIREDYLRILRFFRFSARFGGGVLDPDGLAACARLHAGLATLSAERVWMETSRLMTTEHLVAALEAMQRTGALGQLFPDARIETVVRLVDLEREEGLALDGLLRFATLFWPDGEALGRVIRALKVSNAEALRLRQALAAAPVVIATATPDDQRRALYAAGEQVWRDKVRLAWALDRGNGGAWRAMLALPDAWPRPVFPVTGDDLLSAGIAAGPELGRTLKQLEAEWLGSDFTLGRDDLLAGIGR